MFNPKRYYWPAQFLGWGAYCGLLVLSVWTNMHSEVTGLFILNVFILMMSGILVTHLQRVAFIMMGWLNLRLPALLPRLFISSLISSIIISFINVATDYWTGLNGHVASKLTASELIINIFSVLVLVLFWNAIYFTFHFFQKSRKQEIFNLELAASKRESELKNLRSQLNPHFLFNSLNSIRALVDLDPVKAKKSITTLSNLLRQSLVLGKENLVSLENELNVAKSYLDLEKIRFEERLKVEWEVDSDLENVQIPPFSLQMMVENAIKHGISNLKDGGTVKVMAFSDADKVIVQVNNSGSLKTVVDLGVGIQNVKQRLALQYGDGASFSLKERNGYVEAKMSFKDERIKNTGN